jgi:hypothetical protein
MKVSFTFWLTTFIGDRRFNE